MQVSLEILNPAARISRVRRKAGSVSLPSIELITRNAKSPNYVFLLTGVGRFSRAALRTGLGRGENNYTRYPAVSVVLIICWAPSTQALYLNQVLDKINNDCYISADPNRQHTLLGARRGIIAVANSGSVDPTEEIEDTPYGVCA